MFLTGLLIGIGVMVLIAIIFYIFVILSWGGNIMTLNREEIIRVIADAIREYLPSMAHNPKDITGAIRAGAISEQQAEAALDALLGILPEVKEVRAYKVDMSFEELLQLSVERNSRSYYYKQLLSLKRE